MKKCPRVFYTIINTDHTFEDHIEVQEQFPNHVRTRMKMDIADLKRVIEEITRSTTTVMSVTKEMDIDLDDNAVQVLYRDESVDMFTVITKYSICLLYLTCNFAKIDDSENLQNATYFTPCNLSTLVINSVSGKDL